MLCRAPSIFSNSFSTSFFTFVRKVMMIFLTKTVFPILPISPHDVISFLHPFGQQDKRNGRWRKIEEAEEMMALRARYHFNPRVPSVTDKTRNKTEEKQEITFLNNFSLFLLHFLFVLLLSQKSFKVIVLQKLYHKVRPDFSLSKLSCIRQWLNSSRRNSPERLSILLQ